MVLDIDTKRPHKINKYNILPTSAEEKRNKKNRNAENPIAQLHTRLCHIGEFTPDDETENLENFRHI